MYFRFYHALALTSNVCQLHLTLAQTLFPGNFHRLCINAWLLELFSCLSNKLYASCCVSGVMKCGLDNSNYNYERFCPLHPKRKTILLVSLCSWDVNTLLLVLFGCFYSYYNTTLCYHYHLYQWRLYLFHINVRQIPYDSHCPASHNDSRQCCYKNSWRTYTI